MYYIQIIHLLIKQIIYLFNVIYNNNKTNSLFNIIY